MSQLQSTSSSSGNKRPARHKSKSIKRRKRNSPKQTDSAVEADESDSSNDEGAINWKKLEADLEVNATKANLTAINVKTILHHILKDKRVIEYAQAAASPSSSCRDDCLKMTRSKARLLGHQPLPISKQDTENKPTILDLKFSESSSDEEYQPKDDDEETSQASDEDLSTLSDFASDAASPFVRTPASSVADLDTIIESDDNRFTTPTLNNDNESLKANDVEVVREPGSAKKVLFKLPDVPAKTQEETDLIATRTRSRNPMPNVEVEEIEAAFKPPDSTTLDFSVQNLDDPDEVIWMNWLSDFTKPMKTLNATADDEDPNDEDFNYMEAAEEDTEVETEELRDDKATRITQKELQEMFNELLLGFDQDQQQNEYYFDNWDQQTDIKIEENLPSCPDMAKDLELSMEQYQQITAQIQQHVQLLTQTYILSCTNQALKEETNICKRYIEELALFHNKAIENSKQNIGHLKAEYSMFCTPGIADAYRIMKSLKGKKLVMKIPKLKSCTYQISETIAHLMATEPYFATYIELLPERGMIQDANSGPRMTFTKAEDNLLAIGIEQFKGKDKFYLISEHLLPTKTRKQIEVRMKNLCSNRQTGNPVAIVKKEKFLPELDSKIKITIPRAIPLVPLYMLPRHVWKGKIAPSWFLKESKKLQSADSASIETKRIKTHTLKNNLFSLVPKIEKEETPVKLPQGYVSLSHISPIVIKTNPVQQCSNMIISPVCLPTSNHIVVTTTDDVPLISPHIISTPIGLSSLSSQTIISTPVNTPSESDITSTPTGAFLSTPESADCQHSNAPIKRSISSDIFCTEKVDAIPVTGHFSVNNIRMQQQKITETHREKINATITPVKRDNSSDDFSVPFTQLIRDLPSPKSCPQLNLSPSKPLHETSFIEVKQLLKTPKKELHQESISLTSDEVRELLATPKKKEDATIMSSTVKKPILGSLKEALSEIVKTPEKISDTIEEEQCQYNVSSSSCEVKQLLATQNEQGNATALSVAARVTKQPLCDLELNIKNPAHSTKEMKHATGKDSTNRSSKKKIVRKKQRWKTEKGVFNYEARLKEKARDFANIFFQRAKEVLKNEPLVYTKFFELMESVDSEQLTKLETYYKVADLLSDHPELVDNFAGFLEQHEARHVGKFMQWLTYDQLIQWHLSCEQYFFDVQDWYWKIIQKIIEVTEYEKDSQKIVDVITPMFKGNQELINQFIRLFPDLPPPICNDDDFEVIDFAAVSSGSKEIDDFEEIAYQPFDTDHMLSNDETKYGKKGYQAKPKIDRLTFTKKKSNASITARKLRQRASKRKNKSTLLKSRTFTKNPIIDLLTDNGLSCLESSTEVPTASEDENKIIESSAQAVHAHISNQSDDLEEIAKRITVKASEQIGVSSLLPDSQHDTSDNQIHRLSGCNMEESSKDIDFAVSVSARRLHEASFIEISSDTNVSEHPVTIDKKCDDSAVQNNIRKAEVTDADSEVEGIMKNPIPAIQMSTPKLNFLSPASDADQIHNENAQFNIVFKREDTKVTTIENHPDSDGQDLTFNNFSNITTPMSKKSPNIEAQRIPESDMQELTFPDSTTLSESKKLIPKKQSDLSFKGKISPVKRRIAKADIITLETKDNMTHEDLQATEDFASDSTLQCASKTVEDVSKKNSSVLSGEISVESMSPQVMWKGDEDRRLLTAVAEAGGQLHEKLINDFSLEIGKSVAEIKNRLELLLQSYNDDDEDGEDGGDDGEDDDEDEDEDDVHL